MQHAKPQVPAHRRIGDRADVRRPAGIADGAVCLQPAQRVAGMRERAALINGTLEVNSQPEKGTRVYFKVPLEGRLTIDEGWNRFAPSIINVKNRSI